MLIQPKELNIDVDGVLADLANYFLDWLHQKYDGIRRPLSSLSKPGEFTKALNLPPHVEARFFAEVKRFRHCERLPAYPGAREFIDKLKSFGHDIYACTASRQGCWTGQRAEWLEREMGIPADHQYICGQERKCKIDADYLIDDNWENCVSFVDGGSGRRAIIFDRPWNQGSIYHPRVARAKDYAEVVSLVNETLEWPK